MGYPTTPSELVSASFRGSTADVDSEDVGFLHDGDLPSVNEVYSAVVQHDELHAEIAPGEMRL